MRGSVFKIEKFKERRRRPIVRPTWMSKIQQRICNDYPDDFKFKITKMKKEDITSLRIRENPNIKFIDNDSSSTKRSSRQSSKLKTPPFSSWYGGEEDPINLIKIEEKEANTFLKFTPEPIIPHHNLHDEEKHINDEIEKEIMDYISPDNIDHDNDIHHKALEKLHLQFENNSLDSYHEEKFAEVYEDEPDPLYNHHDDFKRPRIPSRLSGNNSFWFGNERETPNFDEPSVASHPFSHSFTFGNK